jgi:4-hydroxy-tetrahydrodipicolinate reductase
MMIKTCLLGLGKTGMVVAEHLLKAPGFDLAAVFAKPGSLKTNRKLGEFANVNSELVIKDTHSLAGEIESKQIRVAIDFTTPKAVLKNAPIMAEQGVHLVVGTTGFNRVQLSELRRIADEFKVGVVYAPNISTGVNILILIVKSLAKLLPGYDVEISEYHHRSKKDAPSGTALKIATAITTAKDTKQSRFIFGRYGSKVRSENEIGIHAIRAGGIIGVHQVLFSGPFDEIEVTHRSYSRAVFAEGALKAAEFIAGKTGFFTMEEILLTEEQVKNKIPLVSKNLSQWWKQIFRNRGVVAKKITS